MDTGAGDDAGGSFAGAGTVTGSLAPAPDDGALAGCGAATVTATVGVSPLSAVTASPVVGSICTLTDVDAGAFSATPRVLPFPAVTPTETGRGSEIGSEPPLEPPTESVSAPAGAAATQMAAAITPSTPRSRPCRIDRPCRPPN